MPTADDIKWFKQQFHTPIKAAVAGTPFDLDMITAIACQETGYIWQRLRKKSLSVDEVVALCVGDTIDAKPSGGGRRAFPKTKADLLAKPKGQEMFDIARKALVDMAKHIPDYRAAAANPRKFCHGFGVFQYDLQFFLSDPDYFLQRRYEKFGETLQRCVGELRSALKKLNWQNKTALSDEDMAKVAIVYNTGGFKPNKGLKQGHFNGQRFYGEEIFDFIRLARTVALGGAAPALTQPAPGHAIIAEPTPIAATGPFFEVETLVSTLRIRSEPKVSSPPSANVIGQLPDGHKVRAVTGHPVKGFLEIETSLNGAHFRGFASAKFLKPVSGAATIPVVTPAPVEPTSGIVAVWMPRGSGSVTKRIDIAGAHSLNENGQPARTGTTPEKLCADQASIIGWMAVDKAAHKRYRPRSGLTFCNIYAHDYCHLAGVYLPRVWWSQRAIGELSRGRTVAPRYGDTIDEQRANDLFRWLRDFGPRFGWRQTGTLSKLQGEVNQGAIGVIVARRKQDGLSGHIVMVVPETEDQRARRNAAGDVIAPLQSQAGAVNFRYGTSSLNWWKGDQFAESGFWLHA
jgi:hypothetical protein